jgi:hypothetical protein
MRISPHLAPMGQSVELVALCCFTLMPSAHKLCSVNILARCTVPAICLHAKRRMAELMQLQLGKCVLITCC